MKKKFNFRAVQLDLARQMETVDFIKQFIDFIADNGFNVLFLYLEARVRTASFPYSPDNECYSPEQICELVAHAANKGVEIVPGLSALGHAELFLKYPEMKDAAELRDGNNGRFWHNHKNMLCPSSETTKKILRRYFTEICKIFPSQYIHIGMDEAWDIGYCKNCSAQIKTFADEQRIFLEHLKWCRNLIVDELGKRPLIWDDMFEYYADILPEVPRDVILVCWQYQSDVRHYRGHFSNLKAKDILAEYDRLQFEYIIAPSDYSSANIRTFTKYAENHHPLGGLVTSWEKKTCFMYKSMPSIAYAGQLWNANNAVDDNILFKKAMENIFGNCGELFLRAIRLHTEQTLCQENSIDFQELLSISYFGLDFEKFETLNLLKSVLESAPEPESELGKIVLKDILLACEFNLLKFRLQQSTHGFLDETESLEKNDFFSKLANEMSVLGKKRIEMCHELRSDIFPCYLESHYQKYVELIENLPKLCKQQGMMRVRFCLPDKYSSEHCRISLKTGNDWQLAAQGVFKHIGCKSAFFQYVFLVDQNISPTAVRFEVSGYGGLSVCYVDIVSESGHFVPVEISDCKGKIINPGFALDNDCKWCSIGEQDSDLALRNREIAEQIHLLEIKLTR